MGWAAVSGDPNSVEAHAYRELQLRGVRKPPIQSRNDYLAELVRGLRVLDIGCVDHLNPAQGTAPLHRRLSETARQVIGVDIQRDALDALRAEGYVVHFADATAPGMRDVVGGAFDVVVAGEVVEHLQDTSTFFANARAVLRPGGQLILSTPNPHSLFLTVLNVTGRAPDNVDHVVYYWPAGMAEIADRCGFCLVEIRGERSPMIGVKMRLLGAAARLISRRWPASNADCISLIYTLSPV